MQRAKIDTAEPTQGLRIVGPWATTWDAANDGVRPVVVIDRNLTMSNRSDDAQVALVDKALADAGWERTIEWLCGHLHYCTGVRPIDKDRYKYKGKGAKR